MGVGGTAIQRIRYGLTGLAFVFVMVLLGTVIIRSPQLEDSAQTWRERPVAAEILPAELLAPSPSGIRERFRALWRRHAIRRERAERTLATALDPERGRPRPLNVREPVDELVVVGERLVVRSGAALLVLDRVTRDEP